MLFTAGAFVAIDVEAVTHNAPSRNRQTQNQNQRQTQGQPQTHPIKIVGNKNFPEAITQALNLIREVSPQDYKLVTDYIKVIQHAKNYKQAGMAAYLDEPTFYMINEWVFAPATTPRAESPTGARMINEWVFAPATTVYAASQIVHDAYHSKLYHDYQKANNGLTPPKDVWTGENAERQCVAIQKKFLLAAKAPQDVLDYMDNVMKTKWWEKK